MGPVRKPCPTCNGIITDGGSRCTACRSTTRKASRQRNGRDDAHYSSSAWRRTRSSFLAKHKWCEHQGCLERSAIADHDPPRRQLIESGVKNPDHPRWLVALCKRHHDAKTATLDGGFGRPAEVRIRPLDP